MSTIARARTVIGSLYGLMRNALGLNVATPLESQELSCTVSPDRRLVVLGHDPIAGFARDHGTVADEAAMLALHTLDSTTLLAEPTFVAPGDSCLRADAPGWRWHCIAGHGQSLSDWERRPLGGAIADLASGVAGAQPLDADLTAIAAQGVSAWGLTRLADSGATAAKNALGIQRADIGDASTAGRALMAVSTPSEASVPVISSTGSVSTTPLSSLGGGGGGGSRGLFSGLLSAAAPTRSSTGLTGWYHQQASTVVELPHALVVSSPGTVSGLSGITGTVPAGATVMALASLGRYQTTYYPSLMLGFVKGEKFNGLALYWNPTECRTVASVTRYSNATTQVVATTEADYLDYSGHLWLRIRRDTTTLYWECSSQGASWRVVHSEPLSGLYLSTYTTLMFGTSVSGAAAFDAVLHSLTVA